ncbi:DUF421 domain-containing protein [Alkalihalobacillus sp. LMS39]|uniref:DUF421 domain-containing protein n=1 Tax=Alkalihalobacillus sp. LMS39 TaxID=2924032 RepID=UPI001FB24D31|nr:DUF421 domain-containing protein [Alkalihalobacillus sp. LMS39]UOE92653.1 DUF421 domain-containing protein [Alkalihalobacillus sp. LMS39]
MFDFWTGAEDLPVYGFLIRALIVYVYIFILVKILGQRSMVAINPIDFIFGVIIGDVVGEPLSSGDMPLGGPLAAAALIGGLHLGLSYLALKTPRFRRVIEEEPIIIIEKGKILVEELRKAKITLESLLMDLRLKDAADLAEIDFAVLEANGQISVIKKTKYDSVSPADMGQNPKSKGYPSVLIEDGHIIEANLKKYGTIQWLDEQVRKHGFRNVREVFVLTVDETGNTYASGREVKG